MASPDVVGNSLHPGPLAAAQQQAPSLPLLLPFHRVTRDKDLGQSLATILQRALLFANGPCALSKETLVRTFSNA